MSLDNIRIVLVRTFHPGNIGSAARAMKTMGLSQLHLVTPNAFPDPLATQMAAGGQDVLSHARIHSSVESSLADCTAVVAATARPRSYDLPKLTVEQSINYLLDHARTDQVALMFGPERMGLHNHDLTFAKHRLSIPANPDYASLNLAAAVQTLCYELFKTAGKNPERQSPELKPRPRPRPRPRPTPPSTQDMSLLYAHLESVLRQVSFLRSHEGETLKRVQAAVNRACQSQADIGLLRGILSSIEKTLAGEKRPGSEARNEKSPKQENQ